METNKCNILFLMMATARVTLQQSPGPSKMRQWWRRITEVCFCREILMLLLWLLLLEFSQAVLRNIPYLISSLWLAHFTNASGSTFLFLGPFFGWLADIKLGRYKVIIYGTLALFVASILVSEGLLAEGTFGEVLSFIDNNNGWPLYHMLPSSSAPIHDQPVNRSYCR